MIRLSKTALLTRIAAVTLCAATQVAGQQESTTTQQLTSKLKQSVFVLTVPDRSDATPHLGTGFAIDKDLIATNLHVIGLGRPISVKNADGKSFSVKAIHAFDHALDLAILKVDTESTALTALQLADEKQVAEGTSVMTIGNPLGWKFSVVRGVISAKREIDGRSMLQLAMPIEPGNSGGPVFDLQGNVLGVVTLKSVVTKNLGFAVSVDSLRALIEKPNTVPMDRWMTMGKLDSNRWTPVMGANWRQQGGRIRVDGPGAQFGDRSLCVSKLDVPATPYEIEVSVKLDDESGAAGLFFDFDGGNKHYGFYPSAGKLRLSRFDGPNVFSWKVLFNQSSMYYRPGEWNHLRVRVENEKVTGFVNGHLVLESNDRQLEAGKVGLAKFRNTTAEFKGFRIGTSLQGNALTKEDEEKLRESIERLPEFSAIKEKDLKAAAWRSC